MAVFQISRIQIRRGKATSGTGIPQLASGEMAWAVDTQELYIGSGSVTEGAPAVGNTRILTLNDIALSGNILTIGQFSWKFQQNATPVGVTRTLQAKLNDLITSDDFGMVADGVTDNTAMFQNAIDQLYLVNTGTPSSTQSPSGAINRYKFIITPGVYFISGTIHIPSYAHIEGIGPDKVIFNFVPVSGDTSPAFNFINDSSTPGTYNTVTNLQYTNQPRHIQLSNITIQSTNATNTGLQLDSVRDSIFENIKIVNNSTTLTVYSATNIGIKLTALSNVVTCGNNKFKNITIHHTTIAVYSKQDIINNNFDNFSVWDSQQGFSFGMGALGGNNIGQQYGPRQNTVSNSRFYQIRQQAMIVDRGEFNSIVNCVMENVGNNNGNNTAPVYPQVFFKALGNNATNIQSDRSDFLLNPSNTITKYVPEVTGNVVYKSPTSSQVQVGQTTVGNLLLRLPTTTDVYGVPTGAISYNIEYVYKDISNTVGVSNNTLPFTRSGNFYVTADIGRAIIQYADDYSFAGTDLGNTVAQVLTFTASYLDASGAVYTGAPGQTASTIAIFYTNTLANDSGVINYSYTANHYCP
jgi:hypothetical protein